MFGRQFICRLVGASRHESKVKANRVSQTHWQIGARISVHLDGLGMVECSVGGNVARESLKTFADSEKDALYSAMTVARQGDRARSARRRND